MSDADSMTERSALQRVLIASSDDCVINSIRTLIDPGPEARFVIESAGSIVETLEKSRASSYDVLLLDLAMGNANGLEMVRTVHANIDAPIVILTQAGSETLSLQCLEEGAQEYLHKEDLSTLSLRRTLGYAISRHRANDLRLRLEHSDRLAALGQLTAGVAHEINNPATYVRGNLRQIAEVVDRLIAGDGKPGDLELVADMTRDSRQGIDLIASISRELKFYARGDDDTTEIIDIEELIDNSSTMTLTEIRYRARLEKNIENVPNIRGSRAKLSQVLVNLLINAAHAIQEGSTKDNFIRVSASQHGDKVIIQVEDTGTGIPKDILKNIFKPYYTTKAHGHGTGLGLSICQEIIEQHNGSLTVSSRENVGTTFSIELPVPSDMIAVKTKRAATEPPEQPVESRRRRILLIDDEPLLLKSLARMLQAHHDVSTAIGGAKGLSCLRESTDYDLVICDLMMPEVDGLHVYEALAQELPQLVARLIFLSGGVFTERMSTFLEESQPRLLDKPVSRNALLDVIEEIASDP